VGSSAHTIAGSDTSARAIVWADEPTGNLDSETAAAVLELLHEVHRAGQALVVVTHDAGIGRTGQRLVRVTDGRITYDGPPDAIDLTANGATRRRSPLRASQP